MGDPAPFLEWLRGQGTSEQHLAAHRHYAEELAKHPSLSAAIRAHEDAGAPANRIANLRQTAARIAEFEAAGGPSRAPRVGGFDLDRSGAAAGAALDVEPARPREARVTASPSWQAAGTPRAGCNCKKRYDIYLDNDFGSLAKMVGGGIGIGTIILIRFVGIVGAAAIAFGFAGLGGLATMISICFRCEGCRRTVRDLDADERADLRKGRALVTLVTLGFLVGCAVCAYIWWSAVQMTRAHY